MSDKVVKDLYYSYNFLSSSRYLLSSLIAKGQPHCDNSRANLPTGICNHLACVNRVLVLWCAHEIPCIATPVLMISGFSKTA